MISEKITLTWRGATLLTILIALTCYYAVVASGVGAVFGILLILTFAQIVKDISKLRRVKLSDLIIDVQRSAILGTDTVVTLFSKLANLGELHEVDIEILYEPEEACTLIEKSVSTLEDTAQARIVLRAIHAGSVKISRVKLMLTRPARLVRKIFIATVDKELVITPRTYIIARAILHGAGVVPGLGEYTIPKPSRRGFEYLQSRQYEPGDDFRLIDWKATARTGQLHVKELEEPRLGADIVILNLADAKSEDILDRIAVAAILLTYTLVRQGIHVTMIVFSNAGAHILKAGNDREYIDLLRSLVSLFTIELTNISRVRIGKPADNIIELLKEFEKQINTVCYITSPFEHYRSILDKLCKVPRARYRIVIMPLLDNLSAEHVDYVRSNIEKLKTYGIVTVLGREDECVRKFLNIVSTY